MTTVDFVDTPAKHADVTESERPSGEESLGPRRLLVDGKASDAFEMRAEGQPALVSRCQPSNAGAAGSGPGSGDDRRRRAAGVAHHRVSWAHVPVSHSGYPAASQRSGGARR